MNTTNITVTCLDFQPHFAGLGGLRATVDFENGYSASVLFGGPFYTKNGTYEIAILKNGAVCYTTPLTYDVLFGYLSEDEANKTLAAIKALPKEI